MATPSAWRSRPRRRASVSTAPRSLVPSTSTAPRSCITASDQLEPVSPVKRGAARRAKRLAAPLVRDRCPAVAAEGLLAEPDTGRRLAALVLGTVDHRHGALDDVRIEAVRAQLLGGAVFLDVGCEDLVEGGIGRQRILVQLVVPQFCARGPVDDRLRDQLLAGPLVQVPGEPEDVRLEDVLDQGEAAGQVAVQGRVADREL